MSTDIENKPRRDYYTRRRDSSTPEQLEARRLAKKAYDKKYRVVNRDKRKAWAEGDAENNRKRMREKYRATHVLVVRLTPEQKQERDRASWRRIAKRRRLDPQKNLIVKMRTRLGKALHRGEYKADKTMHLLGCSPLELMAHLEALWQPGMTWANYGKKGWHVDHIKPCASFNLLDAEEQRKCFHYTNLQPLWEQDNLRKSDSIVNV